MATTMPTTVLALCLALGTSVVAGMTIFERQEVSSVYFVETMRQNSSGRATGGRTCYGDVNLLQPTGEAIGGVPASQSDVGLDITELKKRWSYYQNVADQNCIQASVIAALASRESRGGALLYATDGYGDHGRAYGILQCDLKHSGLPCLSCVWYSQCHIQMMVSQLLVPYIVQLDSQEISILDAKPKPPRWSGRLQRGGGQCQDLGTPRRGHHSRGLQQ